MGRLIPAGTGMDYYRNVKLKSEETAQNDAISGEGEDLDDSLNYIDEVSTNEITT